MNKEKEYPNRQEKWKAGVAKLFVTYPVKNYLQRVKVRLSQKSMDGTLRLILREWIQFTKLKGGSHERDTNSNKN